jgi:hypothetical protein
MLLNHISHTGIFKKGKLAVQSLAVLLAAHCVSSCKKLVEADIPKNMQTQSAVFTTNSTANAAVNGLYTNVSGIGLLNGTASQMLGLSADEFYFTASRDSYDQFTANTIATLNNSDNLSLWSNPYATIYQANAIVEGLALPSSLVSDSLKKQYTAEARFVRALCHFYLTNMYGKVPLITTTDITVTASQPRNTVDEVYTKIIDDLTYAENTLAKDYRYSPTAGDRTRVNKYAASALLARVYLYRGQWEQAAKHASLVIDSAGLYSLADITTSSPFYKNNAEAIWQYYSYLTPTSGYTVEGSVFRPSSAATTCYALRDGLLNSFEAGDKRKTSWTMNFTVTITGVSTTYTVPLKYKNNSSTSNTGGILEGYTPFRLAEQFLIRAEALARSGNVAGGTADLNKIRKRAGLGDVNPADATALLDAIARERRIELFAEMGHRWLDLKRTNTADAVLKVLKPNSWKATAVLYPIPEEAYRSNTALLPQNDGY